MERADLHFHSLHSDGKHSVDFLCDWLAKQIQDGLQLAVLTDHDGVDGFEIFDRLSEAPWPSIRACELSCGVSLRGAESTELHLLIYGLNETDAYLREAFQRFREERRTRFDEICRRLRADGYELAAEEVATEHKGVLGRPHVADALIRTGVVKSRKEAFDRFLSNSSKYLPKKWRIPIEEALTHCRKKGYRTAIAHPGIYGLKREHLVVLKDWGLDAVEVIHPKHKPSDEKFYRALADSLGLFVSGGSDFHDGETDLINGLPSLGRAPYSYSEARDFLAPFL
ncbi:MAG: PHP domain-containing protein [Bradymonadales bacterium]|nr:MAG: PHP domain-containing protein [Bradymonadales bacterium]